MEHSKAEVASVEKTIADAVEEQLRELRESQLALISGGIGDTYF